jgi:hypothetical protein
VRTQGTAAVEALRTYRTAARRAPRPERLSKRVRESARSSLLHLGGNPDRPAFSLIDYDHRSFGPFLGVSDEGSAAPVIRNAAYASPKARALGRNAGPLTVGVAVDAERLGAIGEIIVGPDEYAEVWLATIDRMLVTTNIGTRVNVRVYKREPRLVVAGTDAGALEAAKKGVRDIVAPFVDTPDTVPRRVTVHIELPRRATVTQKAKILRALERDLARATKPGAERLHHLALVARIGWGRPGGDAARAAVDLAYRAGITEVVLDGVVRKEADEAVSFAGLLNYLAPGLLGPLLRRAKEKGVRVRPANLPDPETIARSIWTSLATARSMGVHLGKYGCFPLTLEDTARVVSRVQRWLPGWSAAPVFFVDQPLLSGDAVDADGDLLRGLKRWLRVVAKNGARIVLIDTVDKAKASRLLRSKRTPKGTLSANQIAGVDALAASLGIKVLWAGGLSMHDAFELGRAGVFGLYVTSSVAKTIAATGVYADEPMASVKEPDYDAIVRCKLLIEAGFLAGRARGAEAEALDTSARSVLDAPDAVRAKKAEGALAKLAEAAWRKRLGSRTKSRTKGR